MDEVHRTRVDEAGSLGVRSDVAAVDHGRERHVLREDSDVQLPLERQRSRRHVERRLCWSSSQAGGKIGRRGTVLFLT